MSSGPGAVVRRSPRAVSARSPMRVWVPRATADAVPNTLQLCTLPTAEREGMHGLGSHEHQLRSCSSRAAS
eukprot:scaffold12455_cov62-Phaeocystis_antarctica.AAC.9